MSTLWHPKRKTYYHRSLIPRKLRHFLKGRVQFWRSLDTANKDEARKKSDQWTERIQLVCTTLKRYGNRMTQADIDALVGHWLESALDEAEDHRAVAGPFTDGYRDDQWYGLSSMFEQANEALISCDFRKVEREADELLKSVGLPALDHHGAEFGRLCRRLLQAQIEYAEIETERWNGTYRDVRTTTHATPLARQVFQPTPPAPTPKVAETAPKGKSFSEVVKLYFNENTRSPRTDAQIKAGLAKFIEVIGGDRSIDAITKADCRTYKESILKDGRSLVTCIKYLSYLNGLFKWSEAQGFIPDNSNPVRGLSPSKRQAKKMAAVRRPFTDAELLKVFGSKDFIKQKDSGNPARYWVPLLCLFQVCRREEAAQLAVGDIGEQDGVPYLNITDEAADQSVKNQGSKRRLPIHSSLVSLGFLEYVKAITKGRHTRLFPKLVKTKNGSGDSVGKFFSRIVTKCGLTDPALVLHSLRHGGITKLHAAGVPSSTVEILSGHVSNNVHGQTYVHRDQLPLSMLREGLEKLRYEEVVKVLTT